MLCYVMLCYVMLKGQQFSFTKTCIERVKCFSENPWVMNKTSSRFKLEVIPLKLFYYQPFFETWHNQHSCMNIKKMQ